MIDQSAGLEAHARMPPGRPVPGLFRGFDDDEPGSPKYRERQRQQQIETLRAANAARKLPPMMVSVTGGVHAGSFGAYAGACGSRVRIRLADGRIVTPYWGDVQSEAPFVRELIANADERKRRDRDAAKAWQARQLDLARQHGMTVKQWRAHVRAGGKT